MYATPICSKEDRIPESLKSTLREGNPRFDVHVHVFNKPYVPYDYFHIALKVLKRRGFLMKLIRFLMGKKKEDDTLVQHAGEFLRYLDQPTMLDVTRCLVEEADPDLVFCPLMMDMTQAYHDKSIKSIWNQLDEMRIVRDWYPGRILPFVALDPNNPDMEDLFFKAFSDNYRFFGVKVYPLLGFLPNHPRLMNLFALCEANDIPVTTHCGSDSTRATGTHFQLRYRVYNQEEYEDRVVDKYIRDRDKGNFFTDPDLWKPVLDRYPRLRLNLAHFGGDEQWHRFLKGDSRTSVQKIIALMESYKNVYTDVSFLLNMSEKANSGFQEAFEELMEERSLVRERVLFGTDFFMVAIKDRVSPLSRNFRYRISDELEHQIAQVNPRRFLGL